MKNVSYCILRWHNINKSVGKRFYCFLKLLRNILIRLSTKKYIYVCIHICFNTLHFILFLHTSPKKCFEFSETRIQFRIYSSRIFSRIILVNIWFYYGKTRTLIQDEWRPVSTSREPAGSELESQSDHISLQYLQYLFESRQVDFYTCDVVNLLMLCALHNIIQ